MIIGIKDYRLFFNLEDILLKFLYVWMNRKKISKNYKNK